MRVNREQRTTYLAALSRFSHLVEWCFNADPAPASLPEEWSTLVTSNLPLWRALRTFISDKGVQPPMRTIRAGILALYSMRKAPVDVATWTLNTVFRNSKHKYAVTLCAHVVPIPPSPLRFVTIFLWNVRLW